MVTSPDCKQPDQRNNLLRPGQNPSALSFRRQHQNQSATSRKKSTMSGRYEQYCDDDEEYDNNQDDTKVLYGVPFQNETAHNYPMNNVQQVSELDLKITDNSLGPDYHPFGDRDCSPHCAENLETLQSNDNLTRSDGKWKDNTRLARFGPNSASIPKFGSQTYINEILHEDDLSVSPEAAKCIEPSVMNPIEGDGLIHQYYKTEQRPGIHQVEEVETSRISHFKASSYSTDVLERIDTLEQRMLK